MLSSTEPQSSGSSTAGVASNSPQIANGKGTTSPPKVNDANVELKNMKPEREGVKGAIPLGEDIMQIARIGEVSAMQRIFEEKKLTANHKDEEGITPLHVRICPFALAHVVCAFSDGLWLFSLSSGPRSITNTRCASFCWTRVRM